MDQTCPTLAQKAHLKHVICVQAPLLSTPNASVSERKDAFNTFFSETGAGKHVPRCVMVAWP